MGWNVIFNLKSESIQRELKNNEFMYLVHSFYAEKRSNKLLPLTDYGNNICFSLTKR